jgi:hypothetical protein
MLTMSAPQQFLQPNPDFYIICLPTRQIDSKVYVFKC